MAVLYNRFAVNSIGSPAMAMTPGQRMHLTTFRANVEG